MKMLVIALSLFATSAFAAEIKVLDVVNWPESKLAAKFEVNRELGRAWVEVSKERLFRNDRQGTPSPTYRQLVPGLSFDHTKDVVTLEHEGQLIECAKVVQRGRSIFRYNKIENTNCLFETRHVTIEVDNGFEIRREPHLHIFLVTK